MHRSLEARTHATAGAAWLWFVCIAVPAGAIAATIAFVASSATGAPTSIPPQAEMATVCAAPAAFPPWPAPQTPADEPPEPLPATF